MIERNMIDSGNRALVEASRFWLLHEDELTRARTWKLAAHARRKLAARMFELGDEVMAQHLGLMAKVADLHVGTHLKLAEDALEEARAFEIRSRINYEEARDHRQRVESRCDDDIDPSFRR